MRSYDPLDSCYISIWQTRLFFAKTQDRIQCIKIFKGGY